MNAPQRCVELLDALVKLGMTDSLFGKLHHFRHASFRSNPPTIQKMREYCLGRETGRFQWARNNELVVQRLEFVLSEWQRRPIKQPSPTLAALAEMAYVQIPPLPNRSRPSL